MAFNRYVARSITTVQTVRTSVTGTADVIIGMRVTNRTASAIKVSAYITGGGGDNYLVGGTDPATMGADVPVGGSIVIISGDADKVVLVNGDAVKVIATGAADCILSVLENA